MEPDFVWRLKAWFASYTRSFMTGKAPADSPLELKIEHTARVCDNMRQLGRSLDLTDGQLCLAEAIGLFHDLGRFEQYRRYRTFNDRQSANHACLSIGVLNQTGVLDSLPPAEKDTIIDAIRFHNAPALPATIPSADAVFMRLIRDADKLDIWRVFADYCRHCQRPEPAIVQHLADLPTWEENIVKAIAEKHVARFQDMKSLNDFKLLQLSWVFDLNYPETYRLAKKRADLAVIAGSLPEDRILRQVVDIISDRLEEGESARPDPGDRCSKIVHTD
jgi:hypothetical protein